MSARIAWRTTLEPARLFSAFVSPTFLDSFATLDVFAAIFVKPAHVRLEPRVENCGAHALQKLADAIAPAKLFLSRTRGNKVHRTREIDSSALKQATFLFRSHLQQECSRRRKEAERRELNLVGLTSAATGWEFISVRI